MFTNTQLFIDIQICTETTYRFIMKALVIFCLFLSVMGTVYTCEDMKKCDLSVMRQESPSCSAVGKMIYCLQDESKSCSEEAQQIAREIVSRAETKFRSCFSGQGTTYRTTCAEDIRRRCDLSILKQASPNCRALERFVYCVEDESRGCPLNDRYVAEDIVSTVKNQYTYCSYNHGSQMKSTGIAILLSSLALLYTLMIKC